jgi:hypothetical protein
VQWAFLDPVGLLVFLEVEVEGQEGNEGPEGLRVGSLSVFGADLVGRSGELLNTGATEATEGTENGNPTCIVVGAG